MPLDLNLSQLLADPALVTVVPAERMPALLAQIAAEQSRLAAVEVAVAARLASNAPAEDQTGDTLVGVHEAARLLQMSPTWVYRNASTLPFTRRVGSRALRFSACGIRRYVAQRNSR